MESQYQHAAGEADMPHVWNVPIKRTAMIGIYAAVLIPMFWSIYSNLIGGWSREDYNYCYIIPLLIVYLLYENREEFLSHVSVPAWNGSAFLLSGIFLYLFGELGGVLYCQYLSSWFIIMGICLLHFGWKKFKPILLPVTLMLAMFPPPSFIHNKLSFKLKLISSHLGVKMMQITGMSAYREGNVIDLGFTQLQVVDACNGIRYLAPLIVLAILVSYFYKSSVWKKIVVTASAVPISILVNGLRIASVGLLYPVWGRQVAEGFFHDFSGWLIFMMSLGLLVGEMRLLNRLFPEKKHTVPDAVDDASGRQEYDSEDATDPPAPPEENKTGWRNIPHLLQFSAAVLLLVLTFGISQSIEFREKVPIAKPLSSFPLSLGGWNGTAEFMDQEIINTLDLSDYLIVDYMNGAGRSVNFYVAYYEDQKKGESIHSPATCLPGSGWVFHQASVLEIPVSLGGRDRMPVKRAFMQKNDVRQLVYYWFPAREHILTSAWQLKCYTFWDALTRQRTDGALVRLMTPVHADEPLADAEKRLQAFAGKAVPLLATFLPR